LASIARFPPNRSLTVAALSLIRPRIW